MLSVLPSHLGRGSEITSGTVLHSVVCNVNLYEQQQKGKCPQQERTIHNQRQGLIIRVYYVTFSQPLLGCDYQRSATKECPVLCCNSPPLPPQPYPTPPPHTHPTHTHMHRQRRAHNHKGKHAYTLSVSLFVSVYH